MSKKAKFKIIMVNSFKGEPGNLLWRFPIVSMSGRETKKKESRKKTREGDRETEKAKEEIYYPNLFFVDIDRLGTSMSYYLFPERDARLCYFDEYPKKKAEDICNEVALSSDSRDKLYAVLLNPVANRKQDYDIHGRMQQHEKINNTIFIRNMLQFFKDCMETGENSLFVVDCSPGLSEMERALLAEFYNLQETYDLTVEEIYVTTFEDGQITKTIDCLNDCADVMYREKREVSIVLNDIQNCIKAAQSEDSGLNVNWESAAEDILSKLSDKEHVKIRYKAYNIEQMKGGIVGNVKHLDNNPDAYVLLKEYREDYISVKSERTENEA